MDTENVIHLLREATEWLTKVIPAANHAWRLPEQEGGSIAWGTRPDFAGMLFESRKEAFFSDFVTALQADEDYNGLVSVSHTRWATHVPEYLTSYLILSYLNGVTTLNFDLSVAGEIAQTFSSSLKAKETGRRPIAPVVGLKDAPDGIECGRGYRVRKMQSNEYLRLAAPPSGYPSDFYRISFQVGYCLECEETHSVTDPTPAMNASEQYFRTLLKCFRLLGDGYIDLDKVYSVPLKPGFLPEQVLGTLSSLHPPRYHVQPSYSLTVRMADQLPALARKIEENLPRRIAIAIGRIDSAVDRTRLEDSFLDHVIAMEALFGDNLDRLPGGITYKLAIRAAAFLFDDIAARKQAFHSMVAALRIRSSIVHGGSSLTKLTEAERTTIKKIGDYARGGVQKTLLQLEDPATLDGNFLDDILLN